MKIHEENMKMKICNFFNIASMGLKITGGALILVDLKTVNRVNEYIISVEI